MSDTDTTIIATIQKNTLEELRVSLTEFHGHDLVDVRVFADFSGADDEKKATKKGVALRVDLITELIEALTDARAEALRRGLIKQEAEPES